VQRALFPLRPVLAALLFAGVLGLAACKEEKKPVEEGFFLKPSTFDALPGWQGDDVSATIKALQRSCARIVKKDPAAAFSSAAPYAGAAVDWQQACVALPDDATAARDFFETQFIPYEIWSDPAADKGREGLFTGYYEPLLHAVPDEITADTLLPQPAGVPLYARPDDLVTVDLGRFKPEWKGESITGRVTAGTLVPYYTRAEIEQGALSEEKTGQKIAIVHVTDPVDAFFLHIQGSGQVMLQDGSVLRVGYAAQNGHKYVAIGKALIERGALTRENVSMQTIRAWLEDNPAEAQALMNENPSYVFFQSLTGDGPLGAEGVALTPGRSLAVDRKKIPYGAPIYLDVEEPEGQGRIARLMVAQDTGGAIRGTVRGDFFWGAGAQAAHKAGLMKSRGHAWILLPRSVVVPSEFMWQPPKRGFWRGLWQRLNR